MLLLTTTENSAPLSAIVVTGMTIGAPLDTRYFFSSYGIEWPLLAFTRLTIRILDPTVGG